jgi:hypothetical protein
MTLIEEKQTLFEKKIKLLESNLEFSGYLKELNFNLFDYFLYNLRSIGNSRLVRLNTPLDKKLENKVYEIFNEIFG